MTSCTQDIILAEIVKRYEEYCRDIGAFPAGDHRTARSEQFLWHSIQSAKAWLKAAAGEDQKR